MPLNLRAHHWLNRPRTWQTKICSQSNIINRRNVKLNVFRNVNSSVKPKCFKPFNFIATFTDWECLNARFQNVLFYHKNIIFIWQFSKRKPTELYHCCEKHLYREKKYVKSRFRHCLTLRWNFALV